MKKLLLTAAAVVVIAGTAFACGDHVKVLSDALMAGKPVNEAVAMLKDLKPGEAIGCTKKDGEKFTIVYHSGGKAGDLEGKARENTVKMFDAVKDKKVGEAVEVSFDSEQDGKVVAMKGSAMSAGNNTVCAVMWPKEEAKKEEAKPAAPAVVAAPAAPAEAKK